MRLTTRVQTPAQALRRPSRQLPLRRRHRLLLQTATQTQNPTRIALANTRLSMARHTGFAFTALAAWMRISPIPIIKAVAQAICIPLEITAARA
jgi:hypothetical protein